MPERLSYQPEPIDTSRVKLSAKILRLTEMLAKNSHDIWARQRLADGWRFGPTRDDARKEHPSLVPYEELSESEKELDRNAALETLKAVTALGYNLLGKDSSGIESQEAHVVSESHTSPGLVIAKTAATAGNERVDDMDDTHDGPFAPPLGDALKACEETIAPEFHRADEQAIKYQKWYCGLVYAAATGGVAAVLLATLQLSDLVGPELLPLVSNAEAVAAFLTLLIVLLGMAVKLKDRWLLERYKAERLRMLKFCFVIEPAIWESSGPGLARLKDGLSDRVKEITAATFSALQGWVSRGWVPRLHEAPDGAQFAPQTLDGLVHYYRRKRLDVQMDYLTKAAVRNFFSDLRMRLAGSALFFGSVAFVLAHLAVQWSQPQTLTPLGSTWSRSLMLVAAALPVLGAGFRTLRTAHQYAPNASRFESNHAALSALSERLRNAPDSPAVFRELGFCEQVLESDLREWARLMVEAEFFG